jgi:hypothetical protein
MQTTASLRDLVDWQTASESYSAHYALRMFRGWVNVITTYIQRTACSESERDGASRRYTTSFQVAVGSVNVAAIGVVENGPSQPAGAWRQMFSISRNMMIMHETHVAGYCVFWSYVFVKRNGCSLCVCIELLIMRSDMGSLSIYKSYNLLYVNSLSLKAICFLMLMNERSLWDFFGNGP